MLDSRLDLGQSFQHLAHHPTTTSARIEGAAAEQPHCANFSLLPGVIALRLHS